MSKRRNVSVKTVNESREIQNMSHTIPPLEGGFYEQLSCPINTTYPELSTIKTTSDKIRFLNNQGKSRSEIAKILEIRYQHVRNVLTQPIKSKE